jgi:hypothetical protein
LKGDFPFPLEEWLKQAQGAGKTALSPSLSDKKSLLQKICGVNLSLQNRKVHFTPKKQWAALCAALKKSSETDLCLVLVDLVENGLNTLNSYFVQWYPELQKHYYSQGILEQAGFG